MLEVGTSNGCIHDFSFLAAKTSDDIYSVVHEVSCYLITPQGMTKTIWLAAALKETGGELYLPLQSRGNILKLVTLEFDEARAELACTHLRESELDSLVESRVGAAPDEV